MAEIRIYTVEELIEVRKLTTTYYWVSGDTKFTIFNSTFGPVEGNFNVEAMERYKLELYAIVSYHHKIEWERKYGKD